MVAESVDRRLLAVLWQYPGQIALMLVHRLHSPCMTMKYKLFDARKKISDWPKSGQVKRTNLTVGYAPV